MASPAMMHAPAAVGFSGRTSSSSSFSTGGGGGGRRRMAVRCAVAAAPAAAAGNMYEVLGLRAGATGREIKAAYRRLALERHPDVAGADGADAAAGFVQLHAAYATLSDPDARARYDRAVLAQTFAQPPAARPRRTWETDQCW